MYSLILANSRSSRITLYPTQSAASGGFADHCCDFQCANVVESSLCTPPKAQRRVGSLIIAAISNVRMSLNHHSSLQPMIAFLHGLRGLVE